MIKTVQIDDQPVEINTSAGWFYKYRENFGHDILPDIMPIIESVLNASAGVMRRISERGGEVDAKLVLDSMDSDDLVDAFIKLAGMEIVTVYNILWAMAKNADRKIPQPEEFFNRFEAVYMDEIIPVMLEGIIQSSISSKNARSLLEMIRKRKEEIQSQ